jgi:uncharacterized LabA/DUF88 family protein
MSGYAVLVDGGFLKTRLGAEQQPVTAHRIEEFLDAVKGHEALRGERLHRVYFYDAAPLNETKERPLIGNRVNFGSTETATQNRALHAALVSLPFVAMRMGELSFRGWGVRPDVLRQQGVDQVVLKAEDLKPNIQQKGVDMRIGLDIAALTLKKLVRIIVLVTGDSDFVPAMKFARREGAQLFLVSLGAPIKATMIEHSDLVLALPGFDRPKAAR